MEKQAKLFEHSYVLRWPSPTKFPVNEKTTGARVKDVLLRDIKSTSQLLIVTGFTSLAHLIEVFGKEDIYGLESIRIVFGFDLDHRISKKPLHFSLTTEVKNYWAKQDVSLSLCGAVINLIEKIENGIVDVRLIRHLHAKLYVGDDIAMLGSSNFSKTGTDSTQREANIRVSKTDAIESAQYEGIKQIAENFFSLGTDYKSELVELLKKLFKDALWEEALARAIAEILENKWMIGYPVLYRSIMGSQLWPTQRTGLAKALKIIQDQGNCLLADPTGSGKTRLGTALLYVIFHWMWENGLRDRSNAMIISPKQVVESWKDARADFKLINEVISMGQLSNSKEVNWTRLAKLLLKCDILLVDEAHNYLNWGTRRSSRMQPKRSAHIVLATATPINKRAEDLLRLIELLDIDNLNEEDLRTFQKLYPFKRQKPNDQELVRLQQYINQFIVRRTKKELKRIIKRSPNEYKNYNDKECCYPDNKPDIYHVVALNADKECAQRINDLLTQLKGINYLRDWTIPDYIESDEDKARYVQRRFISAPALAGFRIKSALRSSRPAVYEIIHGTERAAGEHGFNISHGKQKASGNLIQTLEHFILNPLQISNIIRREWIPESSQWIMNVAEYAEACKEEMSIYQRIGEEVLKMSDSRERSKAALLIREVEKSDKVLAFDATLLTLYYLNKLLSEQEGLDIEIVLATGQDETGKKKVRELFSHVCTNNGQKVIALCSDAMSEGINLPAAKALVLLDVPSVPRIIEQRIGRIERMDSEHKEISVYWPEDDDAFSLKSDQRLVETLFTTDMLIGGNVEIPTEGSLSRYFANKLDAQGVIEGFGQYIEEETEWQGIQDTTSLLQNLIDGDGALINPQTYELYKDVDATIKTAISFIESDRAWSFFALRGDVRRSPKWLFIEDGKGTTDFTLITKKLKEYLSSTEVVQRKWSDVDLSGQFPRLLHFMRKHESLLLPPKKQRALKVGERLLRELQKQLEKDKQSTFMSTKVQHLIKWHQQHEDLEDAVDMHYFADLWLQILQPALDEKRKSQRRKRKPLSLNELSLDDVTLTDEQLDFLLEEGETASKIDEVVASCIISLKSK